MTTHTCQQHRRSRSAFTLLEVLVVVAIIVILASLGGYFFIRQYDESKRDLALTHVKGTLTEAVGSYATKNDTYPPNLQVLTTTEGRGPFIKESALIDPWGKPYQYDPNGPNHNGNEPDIWTVGPDGKTIGNWMNKADLGK